MVVRGRVIPEGAPRVRRGVRVAPGERGSPAWGSTSTAPIRPMGAAQARLLFDMLRRAHDVRVLAGRALLLDSVRWPVVGRRPSAIGGHDADRSAVYSLAMTPFQQGLLHSILGVVAIIAGVVLSITNHISGTDALAIIIAAGGITGTGIAGVTSGPRTVTTQSTVAKPPTTSA